MQLTLEVNKKVLEERLAELGFTAYEAAKRVAGLRAEEAEEEVTAQQFYSAVRKALANPDASSMKTIETLIRALDGELFIRWRRRERVVTGERIVNLDGEPAAPIDPQEG